MFKEKTLGITLISLVITIVVLLILAGVAISVAVNSDGIFGKAEEAKYKTQVALMRDELSLYFDKKLVEELGMYENNKLSANSTTMVYKGEVQTGKNIQNILTGQSAETLKDYAIVNGELKYIGTDIQKQEWFAEVIYNKENITLAKEETTTQRLTLTGTQDGYLEDYKIYGESIQKTGVPTPNANVEMESVGNIEIISYGKNLLKGTNTLEINNELSGMTGTILKEEKLNNCYILKTNTAWHGYKINFKKIAERAGIKIGDVVTYSIWAKLDGIPIKNGNFSFYYAKLDGTNNSASVGTITQGEKFDWKQLSYTFNVTEEILNSTNMRIESNYFENSNYETSIANVLFACPQLEIGNKATQYESYNEERAIINLGTTKELRKVGNAIDYIDYTNSRIIKNTGKITLDNEMKFTANASNTHWNLPANTATNVREGSKVLSNYFEDNLFRANATYDFLFTTYNDCSKFFSTIEELNNFVQEKKISGNPLKLYYEVETESYEYTNLPAIKTFSDVTNIKINTNILPSKISVQYMKNK